MTIRTYNEAPERLLDVLHAGCIRYHERIGGMGLGIKPLHDKHEHDAEAAVLLPLLNAAKAEGAREALERIRAWFERYRTSQATVWAENSEDSLEAILDEEDAR